MRRKLHSICKPFQWIWTRFKWNHERWMSLVLGSMIGFCIGAGGVSVETMVWAVVFGSGLWVIFELAESEIWEYK
jgi:hypothetical protein